MHQRVGVTMVEFLVVLAIISVLLGILLPAVHTARERARELVCKNNVYQINLATAQYVGIHKRLPQVPTPGLISGWNIDILPFIEQKNLYDTMPLGSAIASAPMSLFGQPRIFRCPRREVIDSPPEDKMQFGHYVLVPSPGRKSFMIFDAPLSFAEPWLASSELSIRNIAESKGPHHDGFFYSSGGQQGVGFMLNGQRIAD